jgi:hypothetical protein
MKSVQNTFVQTSLLRNHVQESVAARGTIKRVVGKMRAKVWDLAGRAVGQVLRRDILPSTVI